MLTPEQIEAIRLRLFKLTDPINEFLLSDIARRVSEAGQLTSTAAYQAWISRTLGISQRKLEENLTEITGKSRKELKELLTQSAEVGYRFDLSRLPSPAGVPFNENSTVQQILSAAVKLADADFTNLTQTMGMVDPFGNPLPLQQAYRTCTDYAFQLVITGAADPETAFRRATRKLANHGVLRIDYESGVRTSLEAAVSRNIMGGLGLMQEKISQHNHDTLGADGWEISAHYNCAPDHEPYQGKQYTDAEYQALNDMLRRRIGTLNCGHVASPIILGISQQQYSDKELSDMRDDNEKGIEYEGRHFTGYEATQKQREIERAIRREKRRIIVDEAGQDIDAEAKDGTRLRIMRKQYKEFCFAAGLRPYNERMCVEGWKIVA